MRRLGLLAALLVVSLGLYGCTQSLIGLDGSPSTTARMQPQAAAQIASGRYIIVLKEGVSPAEVARAHGVIPDFVYTAAINGFAGPASAAQARALKGDPRVKSVEPDRVVAVGPPPGKGKAGGGNKGGTQPPQTTPTGIDRIDADLSVAANIDGADERASSLGSFAAWTGSLKTPAPSRWPT